MAHIPTINMLIAGHGATEHTMTDRDVIALWNAMDRARLTGDRQTTEAALARRQAANTPWPPAKIPWDRAAHS